MSYFFLVLVLIGAAFGAGVAVGRASKRAGATQRRDLAYQQWLSYQQNYVQQPPQNQVNSGFTQQAQGSMADPQATAGPGPLAGAPSFPQVPSALSSDERSTFQAHSPAMQRPSAEQQVPLQTQSAQPTYAERAAAGTPFQMPTPASLYPGFGYTQPRSPEELNEAKRVRQSNVALSAAAILLLGAAGVFVASGVPGGLKLTAIVLLMIAFYASGLYVHARFGKLKPAGVALTGIGLALVPITAVALYFTLVPNAPVSWLIGSLVGTALFYLAAVRIDSKVLGFIGFALFVSAFLSINAVVASAVVWYFITLIALGLLFVAVSARFTKLREHPATKVAVQVHPYLAPGALLISLFAFSGISLWHYALLLSLYAAYSAVILFWYPSRVRGLYYLGLRASVTLAAVVWTLSFETSYMAIWYVLVGALLVQTVIVAYSKRLRAITWNIADLVLSASAASVSLVALTLAGLLPLPSGATTVERFFNSGAALLLTWLCGMVVLALVRQSRGRAIEPVINAAAGLGWVSLSVVGSVWGAAFLGIFVAWSTFRLVGSVRDRVARTLTWRAKIVVLRALAIVWAAQLGYALGLDRLTLLVAAGLLAVNGMAEAILERMNLFGIASERRHPIAARSPWRIAGVPVLIASLALSWVCLLIMLSWPEWLTSASGPVPQLIAMGWWHPLVAACFIALASVCFGATLLATPWVGEQFHPRELIAVLAVVPTCGAGPSLLAKGELYSLAVLTLAYLVVVSILRRAWGGRPSVTGEWYVAATVLSTVVSIVLAGSFWPEVFSPAVALITGAVVTSLASAARERSAGPNQRHPWVFGEGFRRARWIFLGIVAAFLLGWYCIASDVPHRWVVITALCIWSALALYELLKLVVVSTPSSATLSARTALATTFFLSIMTLILPMFSSSLPLSGSDGTRSQALDPEVGGLVLVIVALGIVVCCCVVTRWRIRQTSFGFRVAVLYFLVGEALIVVSNNAWFNAASLFCAALAGSLMALLRRTPGMLALGSLSLFGSLYVLLAHLEIPVAATESSFIAPLLASSLAMVGAYVLTLIARAARIPKFKRYTQTALVEVAPTAALACALALLGVVLGQYLGVSVGLLAVISVIAIVETRSRLRLRMAELAVLVLALSVPRLLWVDLGLRFSFFALAQVWLVLVVAISLVERKFVGHVSSKAWMVVASSGFSISLVATIFSANVMEQGVALAAHVGIVVIGLVQGQRLFLWWGVAGILACVAYFLRELPFVLLALLAMILIGFAIYTLSKSKRSVRPDGQNPAGLYGGSMGSVNATAPSGYPHPGQPEERNRQWPVTPTEYGQQWGQNNVNPPQM